MASSGKPGRATLLGGDLFYSPNCSRDVSLPPPNTDNGQARNIFRFKSSRLRHFHQPRWWTATFGWLAFLPLEPCFTGFPLDRLAHVRRNITQIDGGFKLDGAVVESWARLQDYLSKVATIFIGEYQAPALRPFHPLAYQVHFAYPDYTATRTRAELARDWFVVWLGLLSYLFAVSETEAERTSHLPLTGVATWYSLLAKHNSDEIWASGLRMSTVCAFNSYTPRAGIFLHLLDTLQDQPPAEWYCRFSVPVWYPWTSREAFAAARDPYLAQFAPSPEEIQEASTFMVRRPAPPGGQQIQEAPRSAPPAGRQPWVAFFAARAKRHAGYLIRETPVQKEQRLNRARNPPVASAMVFQWDAPLFVREPVHKTERERTLRSYQPTQKRYDPIENEWDCCYEWGPGDIDWDEYATDAELSEDGEDVDGALEPFEPPPRATQRSPSPPPITFAPSEDMPTYEPLEVLSSHFGFIPPSPLPSGSVLPPDEGLCKKMLRVFGIEQDRHSFFTAPVSKAAMAFAALLASNTHPNASSWDLSRNSPSPLVGNRRLKVLRRVGPSHYMFDFGVLATAPWKLAVTDAADALYVCRLDPEWGDFDIAHHLLRRGVRMHTLLPLRDVPTPAFPSLVIPTRRSGYIFTRRDYDAYVRQRDGFLATPRGRAALLRGGIVWRLAAETLSADEVLFGPSIATTVNRNGLCLPYMAPGQSLYDDDLTKEELYLICGAYICDTGQGQQTAIKSWWPLHTTYEVVKAGENYGRWTELSEIEHRRRLATIESGGQPMAADWWRDRLRGRPEVRKMKDANRSFSEAFIEAAFRGARGL